jgi:hypothetical protein
VSATVEGDSTRRAERGTTDISAKTEPLLLSLNARCNMTGRNSRSHLAQAFLERLELLQTGDKDFVLADR